MKTLYHIRHPDGTTIDLRKMPRQAAIEQGHNLHCEVFELRGHVATRIYTPPVMKRGG